MDDTQAIIEQRAAQLREVTLFNNACTEILDAGREAYGSEAFDQRVQSLRSRVLDQNNPATAQCWNQLLAAAATTGDGARILYELADNPDEAQRIMQLPPLRQAVEVTRRTAQSAQPPHEAAASVPRRAAPAATITATKHTNLVFMLYLSIWRTHPYSANI